MARADDDRDYVPALGHHWLTPAYDAAIALTTRENKWRNALLRRLAPGPSDVVLDIGCGTGTLVSRIKRLSRETRVIGIDPDQRALEIAGIKAERGLLDIKFIHGFGDELGEKLKGNLVNKIVSSLVFHQVPLEGKRSIFRAAFDLLPIGGQIYVADFGLQRTALMRFCFKTVQRLDGFEFTQLNADGCLPDLMKDVGFLNVGEELVIPTIVGSISLYTGYKGSAGSVD